MNFRTSDDIERIDESASYEAMDLKKWLRHLSRKFPKNISDQIMVDGAKMPRRNLIDRAYSTNEEQKRNEKQMNKYRK